MNKSNKEHENKNKFLKDKLKKLSQKIDDIKKENFIIETGEPEEIILDEMPTQSSTNAVESGGVFSALEQKQNTLTAGANISISGNTISATDTTYSAGSNITISNNVISATDTIYTAGNNVTISNGIISATDTTYTAGTGLSLSGTTFSADTTTLATKTDLAQKQDVLTAGSNISINNGTISATDTTYTAGTGISISNNVISATGGGLTAVTASDFDSEQATSGKVLTADGNGGASWQNVSGGGNCNCESYIADLQEEQILQNKNINQTDVNLDYVKKYLELLGVPTDPDYNPQPYVVDTSGTVYQTSAQFKRKYNKASVASLTTPKMVFSANNESTGTLDLVIKFTTDRAIIGTINIYQNDDLVFTENVTFDDASHKFLYNTTLQLSLSSGNVFCVAITADDVSTNFNMLYCFAKLTAPNAEVINQISPFFVEYFNGKYYISDCSSGTAKIAEIAVKDMKNMFSINWIDTGIECRQYKPSFRFRTYDAIERVDYYIDLEDKVHYKFVDTNEHYISNNCPSDWAQSSNYAFHYATIGYNDQYSKIDNYTGHGFETIDRYDDECYAITISKYFTELPKNTNRNYAMATLKDGSSKIRMFHGLINREYVIPFGINPHLYFNKIQSYSYTMYVYLKVYDKIVRHDFLYDALKSFSFVSSQEIGNYEEYFEGANDDYFVVKNGKLLYFKKS